MPRFHRLTRRLALLMVFLPAVAVSCTEARADRHRLILATTTSTEDSGLLDDLLPAFEEACHATVDVIAVGTGQALALGAQGDADVVLVHNRAKEEAFVAAGHGVQRYDVMYNDFIVVGPRDDPAGVRGAETAVAAFARIADAGATFVSRGDQSGTHAKERAIWAAAGIAPAGEWYVAAGQGMGEVLGMADEMQGYTLADQGTYLARRAAGLAREILGEGDATLFHPSSVITVNPEKPPGVNAQLAQAFADWITSPETQARIASFQIDGQQLFFPNAKAWRDAPQQGASLCPE